MCVQCNSRVYPAHVYIHADQSGSTVIRNIRESKSRVFSCKGVTHAIRLHMYTVYTVPYVPRLNIYIYIYTIRRNTDAASIHICRTVLGGLARVTDARTHTYTHNVQPLISFDRALQCRWRRGGLVSGARHDEVERKLGNPLDISVHGTFSRSATSSRCDAIARSRIAWRLLQYLHIRLL